MEQGDEHWGGFLRQVMHGFIESNMLRSLDGLCHSIKINNILQGLGIPKEDADASIGDEFIGTARSSRESINTATKHSKETQVWTGTRAEFTW